MYFQYSLNKDKTAEENRGIIPKERPLAMKQPKQIERSLKKLHILPLFHSL